jgi:hypothetical protein
VVLPEEAETGPARPQPVTDLLQSVTDIRQDLADFDGRFGLPPARIQVIRIKPLAGPSASPWLAGVEEVEDTELVHAVAPDATIRELLVDPADVSTPAKFAATFATYVRTAVSNGEVMSQSGIGQDFDVGESSWTSAEVVTMSSALEYAAARHVTVVVASGDYGAIGNGSSRPLEEVSLPASDPWALAADGTTLTANPVTGAYLSETAWNVQSGSPDASGGGFNARFQRAGRRGRVRRGRRHERGRALLGRAEPCRSTGSRSPDTRPRPDGTRSPAGAAPTRKHLSPCSPTTSAHDPRLAEVIYCPGLSCRSHGMAHPPLGTETS